MLRFLNIILIHTNKVSASTDFFLTESKVTYAPEPEGEFEDEPDPENVDEREEECYREMKGLPTDGSRGIDSENPEFETSGTDDEHPSDFDDYEADTGSSSSSKSSYLYPNPYL